MSHCDVDSALSSDKILMRRKGIDTKKNNACAPTVCQCGGSFTVYYNPLKLIWCSGPCTVLQVGQNMDKMNHSYHSCVHTAEVEADPHTCRLMYGGCTVSFLILKERKWKLGVV